MDNFKHEAPDHYQPILRLKSESGSENVHYSVLYDSLPEDIRITAERQLGETDEKRRKGLQKLKEIIKRENMHSLSENYLLAVLRCCKYNLKKSEVKLKKFLSTHRLIAGMAAKLDVSLAEEIIDDAGCGILPYRDNHGRPILYTRPYGLNLDKYSLDEVATIYMVTSLFLLSFPITTVTGIVYFGDCKSPTYSIFYPIFKAFRRHIVPFFSTPIRLRRVEVLDSFTVVRLFYKALSTVLSEKISDRTMFHTSSFDHLHKDYDKNILPKEYGGNLGPISTKFYKQKLLDFMKDLKAQYQDIES